MLEVVIVLILFFIVLIGGEAYKQVIRSRVVVKLEKETPSVDEMPDPYNGDRTDEEFNLGLALVTLLDIDRAPEEYEDADWKKIDELIADAEAYWRMKYNKKILGLANE